MEQAITYTNIKNIGICNVNYNGTNLGATKGGVTAEIAVDNYDRMIDKYGTSLMDKHQGGVNIRVTVPMLELTIANLNIIYQEGTLSGSTQVQFGKSTGTALTGYLLVLEPKDDNANDVVIYSAVPDASSTFTFSDGDELIANAVFHGKIVSTRTDGDCMFRFDSSYSWSKSSSSVSKA